MPGARSGVVAHHHRQHGLRYRPPLAAELGSKDAPAVRAEPVVRPAVHDAADRVIVDPEVVPIDHQVQIVERQPPGRVHHLVRRAGRQSGLALETEDLDALGPGALEGQRQPRRRRPAVPRRPGVEFQEQRLALHLGVPRQAASVSEVEQVLPDQRSLGRVRHGVASIACLLVLEAQGLVEHGQRGVDQRDRMAADQDETIAEALLGMADVPAHDAAEQRHQQRVHLGARAAGMTALAVVHDQVQKLVDDVLGLLPAVELARQFLVAQGDGLFSGAVHVSLPESP